MTKPMLSTREERRKESPEERARVLDALMARAETICKWPVVRTRTEIGPAGLAVYLEPLPELTRQEALATLQLAYELGVRTLEDGVWAPFVEPAERPANEAHAEPAKPRRRRSAKAPK